MQLLNQLNNTTAASQTDTIKLIYRGVSYEVPKNRKGNCPYSPTRSYQEAAQLIGKRLVYRGVIYKVTAPAEFLCSQRPSGKRLIYRGTTYITL